MEIDFPHGKKLRLVIGDITRIRVDAIVNAANAGLRGGGGVDGAIHRAGGPTIMRELDQIRATSGGCRTGDAVVTRAGALPAQHVFHAVGPIYHDGKHGEPEHLASCYQRCLALAEDPVEEAAAIAVEAIAWHLQQPQCGVREVLMVLYDQGFYDLHARIAAGRFIASQITVNP